MAVHSKYGEPGRTKLERVGLRAKADEGSVFNNVGHLIDIELLQEMHRRADGRKAVGVDGVTKQKFGENLKENLNDLIKRIRRGTYRPKPGRQVEIPKEDGTKRPMVISCFEDKLVQKAAAAILEQIYEPIFLPCSHGFRPNANAHEALRDLMRFTYANKDGAVVEIDLQKYFNTIPHGKLEEMLDTKIKDKRFMRLLKILIRAPTIVEGQVLDNTAGCPQGSIISPIFANIYLHYVNDVWFKEITRTHLVGRADMVRYADDIVYVFQHKSQAVRFCRVLPKRLERYGLKLHINKSQLIESGRVAAERAHRRGNRLPTYKFLGFICYWGKARSGFWRLKYKSRGDRMSAKLRSLRNYLWENRTTRDTRLTIRKVNRVVIGWINYHAISDNEKRVKAFDLRCKRIIFKWINRRGGKRRVNWEKFTRILKHENFPERWKTTSMFPKVDQKRRNFSRN